MILYLITQVFLDSVYVTALKTKDKIEAPFPFSSMIDFKVLVKPFQISKILVTCIVAKWLAET